MGYLHSPMASCIYTRLSQRLGAPFPPSQTDGQRTLVSRLSALQAAHNEACLANGNHEMLESVGTVAVVKDMVRIVEALGEDGLNFMG